jgi:hypothetical protein
MNNRIQELAVNAKLMAEEDINRQLSYNAELKAFAEKFAELIILDCIEICKSRVGNSDYNTGRLHCVSDIRERFGLDGMSIQDKKNLIKELLGVKHD